MNSINKVILIGHLGKDPEVRYTQQGQTVAGFSLATSEKWNDKAGQKQEKTEWHSITVWAKMAELCGQYLKKGSPVYIEGKLSTRTWEDRDGTKKYKTEVVAAQVVFLGQHDQNQQPQQQYQQQQYKQRQYQQPQQNYPVPQESFGQPTAYNDQQQGNQPPIDDSEPLPF